MRPNQAPSPLSVGMAWAARITSLGLEFALPALGGHWIDGWLGTRPWVTLLGCFLGFGAGFVHLMQIARSGSVPKSKPRPTPPDGREQT